MRICSAIVLLLGLALSPRAIATETVRIHGSNTIGAKLAPALAEAWLRWRGYDRITREQSAANEVLLHATRAGGETLDVELRAHGTSTGFADLAAGNADIAMASRPVAAAELAASSTLGALDAPAQEAVIALDGVAVIVHPSNSLRALTLAQLRGVFAGAIRDWSALGAPAGPIVVRARDEKSGTWETFRTLVLPDSPLRGDARRFESTQELAASVAAERGAIGFVGLGGIGEARAIAIADGGLALMPAPFTVAVEDYPLSRRLFLYRGQDTSARVQDFVEFALSPAGQRVVESNGFVSQEIRPYQAAARDDAPAEYRALVQGAERLSLNFRFGTGSRMLDSKMLRDVDRLAAFMREPQRRGQPLMLLGFADRSEASEYLAVTLSNDRVDLVARMLEARGLAPTRSRGMGGAAPVASNDTDAGRLRNRRVEVWVGGAAARGGSAALRAAASQR